MLNREKFIERAKAVHGDKYDYSLVEYSKATDKVKIICPTHGVFEQEARAHYRGQGCPYCGIEVRAQNRTHSTEDFIEKAKSIHGNKYDYSKVNYIDTKTKVVITCPIHGDFLQEPHNHLVGMGCPICGNMNKGVKMSLKEFVEKARSVHGEKYDYSEVSYVNNRTPVRLVCPSHGLFIQSPDAHLCGHGCPKCAIEKRAEKSSLSTSEFIKRAMEVHGNKYDYSKVEYKRIDSPVTIICPEHGEFIQKPINHLEGCGCQKCAMLYSNYESELGDFIESLIGKENVIRNDRTVLGGNELDIYIPSKNIAFEFDGLYWHSEIKKEKNYHLSKTEACEDKGIHLIHIFEDEWLHKNEICRSRIRSLLGLSAERIYARKCNVVPIGKHDGKAFFDRNHIQGNVNAAITLGLEFNGRIVSMMSFGPVRKNMGRNAENGCYELLRFCNDLNCNVVGGASKLLSFFIKEYNPSKIISYADRRWSVGNLYEKIGFSFIHNSEPSYFYIIGDERKNRFGFRKDILVSKYGCSPSDTEHNFCLNHKWYRIYDCGTKLYEWKKDEE